MKPKMVTNSFMEVKKDLENEKTNELVHPTTSAENKKDVEPTNVQLKQDVKK